MWWLSWVLLGGWLDCMGRRPAAGGILYMIRNITRMAAAAAANESKDEKRSIPAYYLHYFRELLLLRSLMPICNSNVSAISQWERVSKYA